MKPTRRLSLALVLIAVSCHSVASGQRTIEVTSEGVTSYKKLTLEAGSFPTTSLHYVGSIGQQLHLLMVTKTSRPSQVDPVTGKTKSVGRPSDHVFSYTIAADEITIENGWDITTLLDEGGFTVRPSYCPSLALAEEKKAYTLIDHPEIKMACLEMRRPRIR